MSPLTISRDASRAGACPAGCSVSRNATSAVVSDGTQIFSVRRHIAAALNYLSDELVLRKAHGYSIQSRTSLPATLAERMTVAALLHLKHQRALSLKRGSAVQKCFRDRDHRSMRSCADSRA